MQRQTRSKRSLTNKDDSTNLTPKWAKKDLNNSKKPADGCFRWVLMRENPELFNEQGNLNPEKDQDANNNATVDVTIDKPVAGTAKSLIQSIKDKRATKRGRNTVSGDDKYYEVAPVARSSHQSQSSQAGQTSQAEDQIEKDQREL